MIWVVKVWNNHTFLKKIDFLKSCDKLYVYVYFKYLIMEKKSILVKIIKWDYHLIALGSYIRYKEKNKELSKKIQSIFLDKNMWIKDSWNTYRTINHWTEIWLLEENRENKNNWRKFSLKEMVWIKLISSLRSFWMPLKIIKEIKCSTSENEFEYYLIKSLLGKEKIYFIAFDDWSSDILTQNELTFFNSIYSEVNYILIRFDKILGIFLSNNLKEKKDYSMPLSDKDTSLLIKIMESTNDKEINVRVKDGKIKKYTINNSYSKKELITDVAEINLRELTNRKDSKITIHTNKGKKISSIIIESND